MSLKQAYLCLEDRYGDMARTRTASLSGQQPEPLVAAPTRGKIQEKFLPITPREDYRRQFGILQQGSMSVTQYEIRFVDLTRHALILLSTDRERVRRFIYGLIHPIRLQMAKEARGELSFQTATNVARQIEMPAYSAPSAPISAPPIQSYHYGYPTRSGLNFSSHNTSTNMALNNAIDPPGNVIAG
uniref:Uncharacterized protein LOC104224188 n=1 Tax=Nicotiana sylvestris TaxID=4096 RepID=A0A1U7W641_NICSY|nr:PREDICTED: uncharacterized protein LOC104224188 [Nicotiana sylvestris]